MKRFKGLFNNSFFCSFFLCILFVAAMCFVLSHKGIQFISTGFIGNLLVDITHRDHYREDHIKKIV